jgi:Predicted ATPase (AAA+ superfamily)
LDHHDLGNTMEYRTRIVDGQLKKELNAFGAVVIVGPKWCGKTTTAKQLARSTIYMQDPKKRRTYLQMAQLDPSNLLMGENPRLIDEWQTAPQLWDAVRFDVDMRNEQGLYILTGSTSIDEKKILHSGAGRIARMRMRTMSLFESGNSVGDVSLATLFSSAEKISGHSKLDIRDISKVIVRGGWPSSAGMDDDTTYKQVAGYCETILESDINTVDGKKRDAQKMRAILRSLSRNISTSATNTTILQDITSSETGDVHINTVEDYLTALRRLYVTEDLPAWSPKLRSKTVVRTSETRHLTDPAMAAYFLGASPKDLEFDPETFGLLFESLCIRDLRVYAQSLGGHVYHYRDKEGLEADAVIHLHNGKWGAVEMKLGDHDIDKAAKNLRKLSNKVDAERMNSPSFLAVVTGTEFAYTRDDGVHVVPIGCLRD